MRTGHSNDAERNDKKTEKAGKMCSPCIRITPHTEKISPKAGIVCLPDILSGTSDLPSVALSEDQLSPLADSSSLKKGKSGQSSDVLSSMTTSRPLVMILRVALFHLSHSKKPSLVPIRIGDKEITLTSNHVRVLRIALDRLLQTLSHLIC